ncbi:MAG: transposase [Candidatus Thiodiazotropha endolucinida]|nr:transposase [Candidatus Thiodiazotropha taylori]MCW4318209.1 transposase [Candidatus Thiodiazotropha taylori]
MTRKHSIDVKIKAILKASRPGVLAEEVANEIGIHTFSLYRWKKELRDAGLLNKIPKKEELQTDLKQESELKQLRKENEALRMENAILKKAKEFGEAKRKEPSKS